MQKRKIFLYLNAGMSFFFKQKVFTTVTISKSVVLFLLITGLLTSFSGCQLIRSVTQPERSAKVNKKTEKPERKSYEEAKADFRKRHYKIQSERTQKRMDYNARKSKQWREKNVIYNNSSFFERIKNWFNWFFDLFQGRDKGLYND